MFSLLIIRSLQCLRVYYPVSKFSQMLGQFKIDMSNSSLSAEPEVSGRMPLSGQSPPLRRPVRTDVHPHQSLGTAEGPMPSVSGYAHLTSVSKGSVRSALGVGSEHPRGSLCEDYEAAQAPQPSLGPKVSFAVSGADGGCAREPEDEEESQVVDKTFNRLVQYVYDKYDESRPLSDRSATSCFDFESYFAIAEPHSLSHLRMRVYPRVLELLTQSWERVAKFARESKPLHKVIPLRRKVFPVANEPDFSFRWLNLDFARIMDNKTIAKTRVSAATFVDLEKVEKCSRTLIAGQSQSYWLLSTLLSQLKHDGFQPSDPVLFDKNIFAFGVFSAWLLGLSETFGFPRSC